MGATRIQPAPTPSTASTIAPVEAPRQRRAAATRTAPKVESRSNRKTKPVKIESTPAAEAILLTEEQIAERAYYIWLTKGRPIGMDAENWAQAEQDLLNGLATPSND